MFVFLSLAIAILRMFPRGTSTTMVVRKPKNRQRTSMPKYKMKISDRE